MVLSCVNPFKVLQARNYQIIKTTNIESRFDPDVAVFWFDCLLSKKALSSGPTAIL